MDSNSNLETGETKPTATSKPPQPNWSRKQSPGLASLRTQIPHIVCRREERDLPIGKQVEKIADDLLRRFEPRDPVEEMLIAQISGLTPESDN